MASSWHPPGWTWNLTENRFKWSKQYTWFPKKSAETGQCIWLTTAWYGYRWIDGPAGEEPLKVERWLTDEEYMWLQLSGQ